MIARASALVRAAGLVLVGVTAASLAACSSSSTGSAPTLDAIQPVLARHAQALLDHAQKNFLADVDTAKAAASFRAEQATEFANLADVPLQSWRYDVDSVVHDTTVLAAANKRLGQPVTIVHLILRFQLRDIDTQPSSHDIWWTFVTRNGHVRIAGADDVSQSGGASWQGPWAFGPLQVRRGSACLVLVHPAQAAAMDALVPAVDAAVRAVTAIVGKAWAQRVAVIVPSNDTELAQIIGGGGAPMSLADVSAETVFDVIGTTGAPSGARVIINPDVLGKLTDVGRRIVLQHEITHVAMAAVTGLSMPRWLAEGFAEYVGNSGSGQPVTTAAAELRADVRKGIVPTDLPTDAQLEPGAAGAPQAYQAAWLACRLIATRVGQDGLLRFYRAVGESSAPPDEAIADALHTVVHEPSTGATSAFLAQWRAYLTAQLR